MRLCGGESLRSGVVHAIKVNGKMADKLEPMTPAVLDAIPSCLHSHLSLDREIAV